VKRGSGRTHFCGPNRKRYFQYLSPLNLKRETNSASEIQFFLETTDKIHKFNDEYLLRQMCFLMYITTTKIGGGGCQGPSIFQVLNLENILQDTLGGGSTHNKVFIYTGKNKNTKSSDMTQLVFETTIPTSELQNIVNALHTIWP
jgi:hypothetical protein